MIVLGAGPAGLVLANLLLDQGIDCVVLERADRAHVETRARAGFLAAHTVRILERHGLADGLRLRGKVHSTCEFRTEEGRFRLDYGALGSGETHVVYPQQDLVSDLLARFVGAGGQVRFSAEATEVRDADGDRPTVHVRESDGRPARWQGRYVAGCDGRHGAARRSLPPGAVRRRHIDHGISWLGLLAEAPPSLDAVGYAVHARGFAGHMARTDTITRYYLQVARGTPADSWSEERIWDELDLRTGAKEYGPLTRGRIVERAIVDLESDVLDPLRHGRLLLAGDAAALISPSAAKGANLAVLEAELLAGALGDALQRNDGAGLDAYSAKCLAHVWRAQEFSRWMIELLHDPSGWHGGPAGPTGPTGPIGSTGPIGPTGPEDVDGPSEESLFLDSLRRSRLASLATSRRQQDWFATRYVGL
ncbi:4-hydroxybenzoate 3-monooxygenase [Streptomyces spiroverticillatus]|uniref:4-hydroxybenzoate 3-monooxygenase n=1 Tax=Streptomyces finlayi TaxID=67296 RepID=A0A918WWG4_9ACTN|nr:4-hydroxybenzoate 3-monooxygenase [Streptomyces finlayi]GHA06652.1 4-hydroxybenzoate 3-monooxygenase [Streptomyces spiroverticillatus]GHC90155.1 4-hydroxybenzoate 3-monooxygenase [Streptomyces finlayi]